MHSIVLTMTVPPCKKISMWEKLLSKQIRDQRLIVKCFLQNKQMGRVSKKNWGEDIAYIRNLFALLTAWLNPICLDSKFRQWKHESLYNSIRFMWDKMVPWDFASYICLKGIFGKLDQLHLKENSAINLVLKFVEDGHLDDEMKSLIAVNHSFYRLVFPSACNIIYFNTSKCHILNDFLTGSAPKKSRKEIIYHLLRNMLSQFKWLRLIQIC